MSATGLEVLDKSLQTTHVWLDEIMTVIGPDRQLAWHVLGAVLRTVRDRVPPDLAIHLGAQLPMIVRGLYFDQWSHAAQADGAQSRDEFLAHVATGLSDTRPVNPERATRAVLHVLDRHLDAGQIRKVREALPENIRALWNGGRSMPSAA